MNENNEINNTGNNDLINNNQQLNGSDKIKIYVDTNSNNNTNSYSNINNKELFYETMDDNNFNDEYFNNINNNMKISNDTNYKKNEENENKDFNAVTPLNQMKKCQRNLNNNNDNNINENNSNVENNEKKSKDMGYQTYSGPFRNKKIKVNMIEKENNKKLKHENTKSAIIENDKFNSSQQKKIFKNNKGSNSSHNLKVSVNSTIKKDDKKKFIYRNRY
jgi:hypothetical protein